MKKLIILFTAMVFAAFWAGLVVAGEYHVGTTLICSDCHIMHASQAHGYTDSGSFFPYSGVNTYLLRQAGSQLCLACHDGTTPVGPDVKESNAYVSVSVRQAGALTNDTSTTENYATYKGHTLSTTSVTPPGGGTALADGLRCFDCHSSHGTAAQYRNLKDSRGSVTYTKALNQSQAVADAKDVWIDNNGSNSYEASKIKFMEPDSTLSKYGAYCSSCHPNFHGKPGDSTVGGSGGNMFTRHPTAGINLGSGSGGNSSYPLYRGKNPKVQTLTNNHTFPTTGGDATPSCMSCHKAHGNNNAFGLIYMIGSGGALSEEGDGGAYRDLCGQCHNQGG